MFAALYRDDDKLQAFTGSQKSKSSIDIYSCAGTLLKQITVGSASRNGTARQDGD